MSDPLKIEEGQGSPVTLATWSTVCCMQYEHASGLRGHDKHHRKADPARQALQCGNSCCNRNLDCMLVPIDSTIWLWKLVLKGTLLAATQRMLRR